jgi:hypothetical protein
LRTERRKLKGLEKPITIFDAVTSPRELITESLINFFWGFFGNSIILFMAKEIDLAVFINFLLYYGIISYIVNRAKYETKFGKFIILPGSAAVGAFAGYKVAKYISTLI